MTAEKLCQDFITVIHKEGKRNDPDNYRGICIANSLLKILSSLLETRLKEFCKINNLIDKEQIGFQENARTADHILTLKTIINKYVTDQKGKKLYSCFIDLKKAFDSVWHIGLFRKLENLGINGNFRNLIKSIYRNTKCAVKVNGKTTNFFNYEKGVHHGNPISPLLFNIFINDLCQELKSTQDISLDNKHKFNTLMYADDLIILSTSKDNLQKNLNLVNEYCKKMECMTFTKGTQKEKYKFSIDTHPIENVKQYKYLGITINAKNCSYNPTQIDLSCKATNALYAINSKIPLKLMPIKTALRYLMHVYHLYCYMEVKFGVLSWVMIIGNGNYQPIEKVHTQFLKRMLGVNYSTTNILIRRECGRNPLQENILNRNINYLKYIINKDDTTLVKQALNYERSKEDIRVTMNCMAKKHKEKIEEYLKENENIWNISRFKLKLAINQYFNQIWVEQLPHSM